MGGLISEIDLFHETFGWTVKKNKSNIGTYIQFVLL